MVAAHWLLGAVCYSDSTADDTSLGSNPDDHIGESEKRVTLRQLPTLEKYNY